MGAGFAKQVKQRYPELPRYFGKVLLNKPNYGLCILDINQSNNIVAIGAFQTKIDWAQKSQYFLIKNSTYLLAQASRKTNYTYLLPFPGIGLGGLDRKKVLPIIKNLPDNVIIYEYRKKNSWQLFMQVIY